MSVYIEYALAENCLLDGLLLYLALKCARGKICLWRIFLAAVLGGGEALLFPLLDLPTWCAYLVKLLGGVLLAVVAVSKGSAKTYFIVNCAFFAMTFLLGGLLVAIYSFFEIPYIEGQGYYLESAPVSLVLAVSGVFAVLTVQAAKQFYRYRMVKRNILSCKITVAEKTVSWKGFLDSGNCLSFRGEPVCVISALAALALFGKEKPVGRMTVSTVSGSRDSPVFSCERMVIDGKTVNRCYFTVGEIESKEYQIILHTAFVEGIHDSFEHIKGMAEKIRGE